MNETYLNKDLALKVITERERGKGVGFVHVRRITGYLSSLETWNTAKLDELKDRHVHSI